MAHILHTGMARADERVRPVRIGAMAPLGRNNMDKIPAPSPLVDEAAEKGPTPMTPRETQEYVEQVEEFEGPTRREKRGSDPEPAKEPGVSRS